ncbi:MAG: polysaccharide deacetylase family protein [Bacteroidota bacterium]
MKAALDQPTVSFTFDDGNTNDILTWTFEEWNEGILANLDAANLKAIFFVTGFNKLDQKGQFLLNSWDQRGHRLANHTFSHPNYNDPKVTIEDFETELLRTDSLLSPYKNSISLFRFPYLKEGNTLERIDGFRQALHKHGYYNGHVTIDASDWYIESRLRKKIKAEGLSDLTIQAFQDFYLDHILERAQYYEQLSFELTGRHIPHTLLLHHNLCSALFLDDLIQRFQQEGWATVDADRAYDDPIFRQTPEVNPAGESLIWSLAKASGKYEDQLRYPAEDSRYEKPKMDKRGL